MYIMNVQRHLSTKNQMQMQYKFISVVAELLYFCTSQIKIKNLPGYFEVVRSIQECRPIVALGVT